MFAADIDSTLNAVNGARFFGAVSFFYSSTAALADAVQVYGRPRRHRHSAGVVQPGGQREQRLHRLGLLQLDADLAHLCRRCALNHIRRRRA